MVLSVPTLYLRLLTVLDHVFIGIRAFAVFVAATGPVSGAKQSIVPAYKSLLSLLWYLLSRDFNSLDTQVG